jgi:hypothetical protein
VTFIVSRFPVVVDHHVADIEHVVVMGGVEKGYKEQRQRCDRNQ